MNLISIHRLVASVVVLAFLAGPAAACEALRPTLRDVSTQLAKLLKGRDEDTIAVGAFTGPAHCPASSGPGIKQILIEELQKLNVRVKRQASLEIKGDYRDVTDKNSQVMALRLKTSVLDRAGDVVVDLDRKIEDRDILAQVLGVTRPDLGGGRSPKQESAELKKHLDRPSVDIRNARIQADPEEQYALEIQVKENGQFTPRVPSADDGLAFVPIKKSEVFAVKLINDSDFDAVVELTLDGLSMFAFSDSRNYRFVVVPKHGSALIKGWHRTNQISDEFLITDYSKGAVAELLASSDSVGTITAMFGAAWEKGKQAPLDEGSNFRDPFNPAVGRGQPVPAPFTEVVRKRGRVRDVISVRYKKALGN